MKIRNINGTSQNKCKCGSWLIHWKRFSDQEIPTYCPVNGCLEKELVGAHVQKEDVTDNNWYIFPLCNKHNLTSEKSLEVNGIYKLVSANITKTCGKD